MIVPFNEKMLADFVYDGVESSHAQGHDIVGIMRHYASLGPAYMLIADGRVIAVGGAHEIMPGVGEGWLFANSDTYKHKAEFYKAMKEYMWNIAKREKYKFIQIVCPSNSPEAKRLVEHLGFSEGIEMTFYHLRTGA